MKCLLVCAFIAVAVSAQAETNSTLWSGVATNSNGKTLATITVDTSESPELDAWGERAGKLCVDWYPRIASILASDGFAPSTNVQLRFRKDMDGVAATSRDVINISSKFVKGHTNDFGMIIHELTHVVQDYRHRGNPGWLVEGVADYIRLTHFEPETRRPRINPERASYRDSYKTTAMFLKWAEKSYNKELVKQLNRSMREGDFRLERFKEFTGKTVDELWEQFIDSLSKGHSESDALTQKSVAPM